ncbi:L-threonylcarbamoyladenylate synthase [Maribacter sp. 2210JD10-5]|uniref:L-threonylcarbamoyladenylate synthase n=1 Tax=Maribacter sp. 2210JD10-5 TaxID=3386272 RepID=UPI0039BD6853
MQPEINRAIEVLSVGGLILYPTDTVWGIGCDATNEEAVSHLHNLKKITTSIPLVCIVGNDAMLERHVENVPDLAYDIMDLSEKPTTIIYDKPRGIAKNIIAQDGTLAIRVASDKFCQYLITKFKKPIVSTSANVSGRPVPKSFQEIDKAILTGVDYVVNLHQDKKNSHTSAIIRLGNNGVVKVVRE